MKLLFTIIFLLFFMSSYGKFGTIKDVNMKNHGYGATSKGGNGNNPCGHGNQPPCPIPLDTYQVFLIIGGVLIAIKKIKNIKTILIQHL